METSHKKGLGRGRAPFAKNIRLGFHRLQVLFGETFGLGPGVALSAIIFTFLVLMIATFWFFKSAPPDALIITSGDEGSLFQRNGPEWH